MTRHSHSTRTCPSVPTASGEIDPRSSSLRAIVALLARQAAREWVASSVAAGSDAVSPSNHVRSADHA